MHVQETLYSFYSLTVQGCRDLFFLRTLRHSFSVGPRHTRLFQREPCSPQRAGLRLCGPEHYITWRRPSSHAPHPWPNPQRRADPGTRPVRQQGRATLGAGVTESFASPGRGGGISPVTVSGGRCLRPRPLRRLRPVRSPPLGRNRTPGAVGRGRRAGGMWARRRQHCSCPREVRTRGPRDAGGRGSGRGLRSARRLRRCPGAESSPPVLKVSQLCRTGDKKSW